MFYLFSNELCNVFSKCKQPKTSFSSSSNLLLSLTLTFSSSFIPGCLPNDFFSLLFHSKFESFILLLETPDIIMSCRFIQHAGFDYDYFHILNFLMHFFIETGKCSIFYHIFILLLDPLAVTRALDNMLK